MCLYLSVNKVTKTCLPLQNDECLYKNFIISTISFFGHNYFTTNEVSFVRFCFYPRFNSAT